MKEIMSWSPKWLPRLFPRFIPRRATAQGTEENTAVGPISMNAIASAERALRWISKVPGGDKVQVRIGGVLQVIKGLNVASPDDVNTLKWLEYHVRYLAELLEPFAMMHRSEISPLLQYEVLMLGRELTTASLKMKPIALSNEDVGRKSLGVKPREEHVNAPDIRVFTQDFKSALDQFRTNALPLYTISPIEAALLPLGVILNSSWTLLPFVDWILKSERVMEYRIGAVRSIYGYERAKPVPEGVQQGTFILVRLENGRQIENWLKIESGPDRTVTFGTTKETLHEGLDPQREFHIAEDTLPVTRFAQKINAVYEQHRDDHLPVALFHRLEQYGDQELREH